MPRRGDLEIFIVDLWRLLDLTRLEECQHQISTLFTIHISRKTLRENRILREAAAGWPIPRYFQGTKWHSERSQAGHILVETLRSANTVALVVGPSSFYFPKALNCRLSGSSYLKRDVSHLVIANISVSNKGKPHTPYRFLRFAIEFATPNSKGYRISRWSSTRRL